MHNDHFSSDVGSPAVPRQLETSRICSQGGYAVVSGMIGRNLLDGLKAEAEIARPSGWRTILPFSDGTEQRGGSPARALRSSPCGEVHRALHASRQLTDAIGEVCGIAVTSSGVGTYHFYEHAGDFFALH